MRENGAVVYAEAMQTSQSASLRWLLSAGETFEQFYARFQLLLTPTAPTVPQPCCPTVFLAEEDSLHEVGVAHPWQ